MAHRLGGGHRLPVGEPVRAVLVHGRPGSVRQQASDSRRPRSLGLASLQYRRKAGDQQLARCSLGEGSGSRFHRSRRPVRGMAGRLRPSKGAAHWHGSSRTNWSVLVPRDRIPAWPDEGMVMPLRPLSISANGLVREFHLLKIGVAVPPRRIPAVPPLRGRTQPSALARIIRGGLDSDTSGVWKVAGVQG